jgi:AbrB family looped-hinge helix DNA binding protein
MPIPKVTRNYQITLPTEVRRALDIREGEYPKVEIERDGIILRKLEKKRKRIKLGKRITIDEIEKEIEEGFRESMQ